MSWVVSAAGSRRAAEDDEALWGVGEAAEPQLLDQRQRERESRNEEKVGEEGEGGERGKREKQLEKRMRRGGGERKVKELWRGMVEERPAAAVERKRERRDGELRREDGRSEPGRRRRPRRRCAVHTPVRERVCVDV